MSRQATLPFALATVLLVGACTEAPPGSVPPRTPGAAPAPAKTAEGDAPPGPESKPEISIEEARAPATPARWQAPRDCPLTYDYRVSYRMEMASLAFGSGFDLLGQLESRADPAKPARASIKYLWARSDVVAPTGTVKGVRTTQNLGAVQVSTDGARWTEADAKSGAQASVVPAFVGYTGIVNLWPTLPASPALGTTATWKVPPQTIAGISLSAFGGGRTPAPTVDNATIQIAKWVKVGGDLACVLEGSWEKEQTSEEKVSNQRVTKRATVRGAARFLVLASGRLLSSEVRQATDTLATRQGERLPNDVDQPSTDTHEDIASEIRLVGACNGATLPTIHSPPSAEERALMLHVKLREVLSKPDRAALAALLAPELTAKQGKDAVVDALLAHVKRFGDNSLGMATSPAPGTVRTDGDRVRFDLVGIAVQNAANGDNFVVTVSFDVERKGDEFYVRSIKAVTQGSGPVDVLEVSEARVFRGDPPKQKTQRFRGGFEE